MLDEDGEIQLELALWRALSEGLASGRLVIVGDSTAFDLPTPSEHAIARAWRTSGYVPGMMWVIENAMDSVSQLGFDLASHHRSEPGFDVITALRNALPTPPPLDQLLARAARRNSDECF